MASGSALRQGNVTAQPKGSYLGARLSPPKRGWYVQALRPELRHF